MLMVRANERIVAGGIKTFRKVALLSLIGFNVLLVSACGGDTTVTSSTSSSSSSSSGSTTVDDCLPSIPEKQISGQTNWTSGELTLFNDNGGWTWLNDERAIIDSAAGKLIVGSAASGRTDRPGSIDVVVHDLASGQNNKTSLGTLSYPDDHNNPGIVITAPGEYLAAYAHHNVNCDTYWSHYVSGSWSATETFTWKMEGFDCPWTTSKITFNNPWRLSDEGRIYNFIRSVGGSPNFLLSEDDGVSWEYGGRLTASPLDGFPAGHYKYWGNGRNRIDFFTTETNPRFLNTSLYHGYIQDGKSYDSFGNVIDNNIFDGDAPQSTAFTRIFKGGAPLDALTLNRLWNLDIVRYDDGSIAVLWQGRENECSKCFNLGHHLAYSRFDGESWVSTRLTQGGRTLYRDITGFFEEDFLGGGALDPNDPNVVYVSTNIDPRNDSTDYPVHEIWKGETCDKGKNFSWTPITMNSEHENLRPTVPAWDTKNTALLWFRGNYQTAQLYNAEIVGILTRDE